MMDLRFPSLMSESSTSVRPSWWSLWCLSLSPSDWDCCCCCCCCGCIPWLWYRELWYCSPGGLNPTDVWLANG